MATSYQTPNMNLTIPVAGQEPGPNWASDLNISLTVLDSHTHNAGSGIQITPTGLNINSDLTFNVTNNAIALRSVRFAPQSSALSGAADLGCLYEAGADADLYYNDGSGNQIRITESGSVAGSSGTITGLPSGTASASYQSASGTFQFQQATSTAANLDVASVLIRYPGSYPTPSGAGLLLSAPSSIANVQQLTLPTIPAQISFLVMDTSGIISAPASTSANVNTSGSITTTGAATLGTLSVTGDSSLNGNLSVGGSLASGSFASGTTSVTTLTVTGTSTFGGTTIVNTALQVGTTLFVGGVSTLSNTAITGSLNVNSKTAVLINQTGRTYSLGMLRGIVNGSGTPTGGEGFIASGSAGNYTVTFGTPFIDVPSVVATSNGGNFRLCDIVSCTTAAVNVEFAGGATPFSFIAIGRVN